MPPYYSHPCQTPWSVFQDGSDRSVGRHDPGQSAAPGGAGHGAQILGPGPARRLPRPKTRVARLLAGPEPIVPPQGGARPPWEETERYACFQRFHVLFHFLFKVLFIFPSRYLFAIGLEQIFSFGRTLPPGWRCSPKQHDSREGFLVGATARDGAMTLSGSLSQQRITRGAR